MNALDRKKHSIFIGIDPGTNTGIAIFHRYITKPTFKCATVKIHEALEIVRMWSQQSKPHVFIRVEDPRQIGSGTRSQFAQQGVGSVKRDATIWEDFLTDLGVDFEMVRPKSGATKWTMEKFRQLTKYEGKCDNHARDAGVLVYGL